MSRRARTGAYAAEEVLQTHAWGRRALRIGSIAIFCLTSALGTLLWGHSGTALWAMAAVLLLVGSVASLSAVEQYRGSRRMYYRQLALAALRLGDVPALTEALGHGEDPDDLFCCLCRESTLDEATQIPSARCLLAHGAGNQDLIRLATLVLMHQRAGLLEMVLRHPQAKHFGAQQLLEVWLDHLLVGDKPLEGLPQRTTPQVLASLDVLRDHGPLPDALVRHGWPLTLAMACLWGMGDHELLEGLQQRGYNVCTTLDPAQSLLAWVEQVKAAPFVAGIPSPGPFILAEALSYLQAQDLAHSLFQPAAPTEWPRL